MDDVERRYLKTVFKPFKDKKILVEKVDDLNEECLLVTVCGDDVYHFPDFKKGTMYKGMEPNKDYTLEELGIKYN